MSVAAADLWSLIRGGREVDPTRLAAAIVRQLDSGDLDFRTRLLIRDSLDALHARWGEARLARWIEDSGRERSIHQIWQEGLGDPGFPSLTRRVMEPTTPDNIFDFLRDLGGRLRTPAKIHIGGSAALIVAGLLSRMTEDIDLVDEVPPSVRSEHAVLDDLERHYDLRLAHFQCHYLPDGWQSRVRSLGRFRELDVYIVEPYDICLSKLFSDRSKVLSDLRFLRSRLDKNVLRQRLLSSGGRLRGEEKLRQAAEHNWYVLYDEPLPT